MYRPPNPPEKFKMNFSVRLARLKPPRAIWRLCSPHCSPEVNPGDAIARAVLGSVCLLDVFPECLARAFSRTKPSRLFRRRHLSKMLTPPGPVITRRSNRKVTKKKREFHVLNHVPGAFSRCFRSVNNLYLGMEKTRSGRPGLKVFHKLLTITVSRAIFFPGYTREDANSHR